MNRAPLMPVVLAFAAALAWPLSQAVGAASGRGEPSICREMTPARILQNPALAEEWAQALRSERPEAIERVRAMLAEIRAAHGCAGEPSAPKPVEGRLPPGHPPIHGFGELPPGHPPIPPSPRAPLFEAPAVLTI